MEYCIRLYNKKKKVYKYYKIAAFEDSYRVRIDTVWENNC